MSSPPRCGPDGRSPASAPQGWFVVALCGLLGCSGPGGSAALEDVGPDVSMAGHDVDDAAIEDSDGGRADTAASDLAETSSGGDLSDDPVEEDALPELGDAQDTDVPEVPADAEPVDSPWRSALFPEDWTPGFSASPVPGLEDYSYAGYAAGLRPEGAPAGATIFDVGDFGLPLGPEGQPDGLTDTRAAIQGAIDAASEAGGGVVWLPRGLYRVDGRLRVESSAVVLRGQGPELTRLFFTLVEGMNSSAHLSFGGSPSLGPDVPLLVDAVPLDFEVHVGPDALFDLGDEVVIGIRITEAFVERHRMTGIWRAFNGTWQPFERRTVVEVQDELDDGVRVGRTLRLDVPLRSALSVADEASVRRVAGQLRECGVEDLALSNAVDWHEAWTNTRVHVLAFRGVRDSWVTNVRSFVSPLSSTPEVLVPGQLQSSGILVDQSRHVTLRNVHLGGAQHRGGGGNGYLFEIMRSNEILTVDSSARDGRHNFIQNWGFGTSGCVWLRVYSVGSAQVVSPELPLVIPAASEYHHSLATSNLVDQSEVDDAWFAQNRGDYSTGAGITAWKNVFYNLRGRGEVHSMQWGYGYVIGTGPALSVRTSTAATAGLLTEPEDWVEGAGLGRALTPPSLYEAQLEIRRAALEEGSGGD